MTVPVLKSYPYKPKLKTMTAAGLMFGACSAVLAITAYTNDRGLVINGIVELGVDGASSFYWVLSVLSLVFVATALLLIIGSIGSIAQLQITSTHVKIPAGFFRLKRSVTVVSFADVSKISESEVHRQRFLSLCTPKRTFTVACSMMPSAEAYEEAKKLIREIAAAPGIALE